MAKLNKLRQEIADKFIQSLKEDKILWEKCWNAKSLSPVNAITNRPYNGLNLLWLYFTAEDKNFSDNRWCTFKQATDKGWTIKKGSKGTRIEFWSLYDTEEKKKLSASDVIKLKNQLEPEEFDNRVKPISSIYTVFNGEQIDGIPELPKVEGHNLDTSEIITIRDKILKNMQLNFKEGGNRCFYRPFDDCINLPKINTFKDEYSYMATFLHEAGHATGAEHRLNRNLQGYYKDSVSYAKEELRAEIASVFSSVYFGIGVYDESKLNNHKAYIQDWIEELENNPNELFSAIKEASKISDYLIEKSEYIVSTETPEEEFYYKEINKEEKDLLSEKGFTEFVGSNDSYIVKVKSSDKDKIEEILQSLKQNGNSITMGKTAT